MIKLNNDDFLKIIEIIQPIADQATDKGNKLVEALETHNQQIIEAALNDAIIAIGELERLDEWMLRNTKKISRLTKQAHIVRQSAFNKPIEGKTVQERIMDRITKKYPHLAHKVEVI